MSGFTILHNPRCSKSRQTLALLQENNIEPVVIEYLKQPLAKSDLQELLKKLHIDAASIVRTKEAVFKELNLDLSDQDAVLQAIVDNPVLLERPIVYTSNKAAIGRPPENVLPLLN